MRRCAWAQRDVDIEYHDKEWGVPVHDDRHLFEMLILEVAQAGLSWTTILRKRDSYREAYENFEISKVAAFDDKKNAELLQNPGIIRNRLNVAAAVKNARAVLQIQREFGSLDSYLWAFVGGKTILNSWKSILEIPAKTAESDAMSKDLKKRGCSCVGSTICYAFMQGVGMINDHEVGCFRYSQVSR